MRGGILIQRSHNNAMTTNMTVLSREGEEKYQWIMTNWVRALSNQVTRETVEEGWRECIIAHRAYQAFEMMERQAEAEEGVVEQGEGDEGRRDGAAQEILMLGDEGYEGAWGVGMDAMLMHVLCREFGRAGQ